MRELYISISHFGSFECLLESVELFIKLRRALVEELSNVVLAAKPH